MQAAKTNHPRQRSSQLIDFPVDDNGVEFIGELARLTESIDVGNLPAKINFSSIILSEYLDRIGKFIFWLS
jgi:hypothetical protein